MSNLDLKNYVASLDIDDPRFQQLINKKSKYYIELEHLKLATDIMLDIGRHYSVDLHYR